MYTVHSGAEKLRTREQVALEAKIREHQMLWFDRDLSSTSSASLQDSDDDTTFSDEGYFADDSNWQHEGSSPLDLDNHAYDDRHYDYYQRELSQATRRTTSALVTAQLSRKNFVKFA